MLRKNPYLPEPSLNLFLTLFLFSTEFQPQCSDKIVLIKKRVYPEVWQINWRFVAPDCQQYHQTHSPIRWLELILSTLHSTSKP